LANYQGTKKNKTLVVLWSQMSLDIRPSFRDFERNQKWTYTGSM